MLSIFIEILSQEYLIFLAKVLITTGFGEVGNGINDTEVFDLFQQGNKCTAADYPLEVQGAAGDLVNGDTPMICGGLW